MSVPKVADRNGQPLPDDILEALGLIAYAGFNTARVSGSKPVPVVRQPEDWFQRRGSALHHPDQIGHT